MLCYTVEAGYDNQLMMAEAAAFGYAGLGCLEMVQQQNHLLDRQSDREFLLRLTRDEDLFLDREPWHQVAVLRHHASELLNPFPCSLTPYVVEQMLFEAHVPFAIIGEGELTLEHLRREFSVLVLPDSKCLSDDEITVLCAYVNGGGRLLSIGKTGTATPLNQYRESWGLGELFGHPGHPVDAEAAYEETAGSERRVVEGRRRVGRLDAAPGAGRVIHLPPLDFVMPGEGEVHAWQGYPWYYHPYWRPPRDAQAFLSAVDELIGGDRRVRTSLPRHVGLECYTAPEGYRFCLVNYAHPEPVAGASLTVRLGDEAARVNAVDWHGLEGVQSLAWRRAAGVITIELPAFALLGTMTVRR
jgi:hypothetical protein